MGRARHGWSGVCFALVILNGCSGSGDAVGSNGRSGPGKQASAGTGAGNGSSAGAGDFGNGTSGIPNDPGPLPMVTDAAGSGAGSDNSEPISIDDCGAQNPAGLSADDAQKLMAGSGGGGLRVLYPYDGTVFPRGLFSPLMMWDGVTGDYVYVHIKTQLFEYKGCLTPTAAGQLQLPQAVWDQAGAKTLGTADPATVELSVMSGGTVTGPATFSWTIAQATIKGSIFYNSYTSLLPGNIGGSVLRIQPGGTAERFTAMECNGCHSVSVNGARLLSMTLGTGGRSYAIAPNTPVNPPAMNAGVRTAFGALYPDGSAYLATSTAIEVARAGLTSLMTGAPSALFETDTGNAITGTGIPTGALMPSFSPDGKLLAFNDYDANMAHGLVVMDYDTATHTATNRRVLFMDTDMRPGWPFALPDDNAVMFTRTTGADFSGDGAGLAGIPGLGPVSDLYMVDVKTSTSYMLARAMGFNTDADAQSDTTYLPFGAEDVHKNYFPTVSPVAAGGYFWIFFDAVRHYGNLGLQRQLWGAAVTIDPNGDYAIDHSHPPYYLPGQEFGTGNHRAFAALDPCKQDGDDCTSGIDCCGGFCSIPEGGKDEFGMEPKGTCSSKVPMCANTNERCTSDADCCAPESPDQTPNTCIAGYCAVIIRPQ